MKQGGGVANTIGSDKGATIERRLPTQSVQQAIVLINNGC